MPEAATEGGADVTQDGNPTRGMKSLVSSVNNLSCGRPGLNGMGFEMSCALLPLMGEIIDRMIDVINYFK